MLFTRFQGSTDARTPWLGSASRARQAAGGSGAVDSDAMDKRPKDAGEAGEAEGVWEEDEALSADELADVEGW
jgi:hypothetical protein